MQIHIKDIKKGDMFWEKTIQMVALEDAREKYADFSIPGCSNPRQWLLNVQAVRVKGREIPETERETRELLVTEGAEHYGPKLYDECAYV